MGTSTCYYSTAPTVYENNFPTDLPGPPVGPVKMTNVTTSTIDLHWHPPETTGGGTIIYLIHVRRNFNHFHCVGCVKTPSVRLSDLLYTQTYTLQVFSHNSLGHSLPLTSATIYPLKSKAHVCTSHLTIM